jgi:hypothetical protein
VIRALAPLLAAVAVLAGCGGADEGTASLWVTRDRGAHVVLVRDVPAGLTALQALDREADIETRYGGRFVRAINGIEGSLTARRDWFYFVNGYEADRGAAEYRVHAGDVIWWDFREWSGEVAGVGVVVGAFPEPFLHGYDGNTRPAVVRYSKPEFETGARAIGKLIGAESVASWTERVPPNANLFLIDTVGGPHLLARKRPGSRAGSRVIFILNGDAMRLARHPQVVRFRYQIHGALP